MKKKADEKKIEILQELSEILGQYIIIASMWRNHEDPFLNNTKEAEESAKRKIDALQTAMLMVDM